MYMGCFSYWHIKVLSIYCLVHWFEKNLGGLFCWCSFWPSVSQTFAIIWHLYHWLQELFQRNPGMEVGRRCGCLVDEVSWARYPTHARGLWSITVCTGTSAWSWWELVQVSICPTPVTVAVWQTWLWLVLPEAIYSQKALLEMSACFGVEKSLALMAWPTPCHHCLRHYSCIYTVLNLHSAHWR